MTRSYGHLTAFINSKTYYRMTLNENARSIADQKFTLNCSPDNLKLCVLFFGRHFGLFSAYPKNYC